MVKGTTPNPEVVNEILAKTTKRMICMMWYQLCKLDVHGRMYTLVHISCPALKKIKHFAEHWSILDIKVSDCSYG